MAALRLAAEDDDPLIAESARSRLELAPAVARSIVDKVITLRDVSIFSEVPDEALVGVARLLTDRQSQPGDVLIEEGDHGDSLYVIESGKVRVHQGDRTFREMGAREFFGELSLLDAEPRSASVTSIEHTHAYRLSQDDFYVLVNERPEIARSINRALCRMIRTGE